MGENFIWRTLARVHYDEGRLEEAEQLEIQVMETRKTKLGEDYPDTLASMANLDASILCKSITSNLQNLLYPVGQVEVHSENILRRLNVLFNLEIKGEPTRWLVILPDQNTLHRMSPNTYVGCRSGLMYAIDNNHRLEAARIQELL
ncbi:hypothetical protein PENARI_c001G03421 [Penicillium arizonense]|uniref:MalT-like TPR region domain-containing protein n=1 Tax=Penicillium arizonense TaxID=1835702 RepID=A0A1F5LZ82_PENAI|nr:hypothetical protein PENARI_c001G03421 [Penicillium arizonense]OGE58492.1 hypothetical protein PENARI_c001G03421 [Penicillium arizonense]